MNNFLACLLCVACSFVVSFSSSELSFRVTIPGKSGTTIRLYSDANDIVSVTFNAKGKIRDCDVVKKNRDAVKELFYQSLAGNVGNERVVQDMDVPELGRQCKKFLRDMKRKKPEDKSSVVKEFKKHMELKDGVHGTKWCKLVAPSDATDKDFGKEKVVDKCCQQLHACKDTIDALRVEHKLYNHRPYKLPSCQCLRTFNKCLSSIKSNKSHHVHHLFFDIEGISCFEMKDKNTCVGWNKWYTKCTKYTVAKVALRKSI